MQKNLIICPSCENKGTKTVLGKLFDDGSFKVVRYHQYSTVIKGSFRVICGRCNELTYLRKEK